MVNKDGGDEVSKTELEDNDNKDEGKKINVRDEQTVTSNIILSYFVPSFHRTSLYLISLHAIVLHTIQVYIPVINRDKMLTTLVM